MTTYRYTRAFVTLLNWTDRNSNRWAAFAEAEPEAAMKLGKLLRATKDDIEREAPKGPYEAKMFRAGARALLSKPGSRARYALVRAGAIRQWLDDVIERLEKTADELDAERAVNRRLQLRLDSLEDKK